MSDEFPLEPARTALLFFDATFGLHLEHDETTAFVDGLATLANGCREAGVRVFYAQAEHRRDGSDWGVTIVDDAPRNYDQPTIDHVGTRGKTYFRGVNFKGSKTATILPEIAPQEMDYVVAKHRWSAFYQTALELSLRTAGIDTIILAGGATEIGIASTAYAARDADYNLIIASDACREWAPGMNDFWMRRIFPMMSRVMTVGEILDGLAAVRSTAEAVPAGR